MRRGPRNRALQGEIQPVLCGCFLFPVSWFLCSGAVSISRSGWLRVGSLQGTEYYFCDSLFATNNLDLQMLFLIGCFLVYYR